MGRWVTAWSGVPLCAEADLYSLRAITSVRYKCYDPSPLSDIHSPKLFTSDITYATMAMQIVLLFPVVVVILLLVNLLWRTASSYLRLRSFPGPPLASFTNFWLLNKFWKQEPWREISRELHKTYGPVVRYGPNRLAFGDPASIPTILATSNVFEKVSSS